MHLICKPLVYYKS